MPTTIDAAPTTVHVKRIFVVDDHPIVRQGLEAQLAMTPNLKICGEAEDVAEALNRIADAKPDLCVIDISLKTGNGIDLIKRLKARMPTLPILVWSMYPDNVYAERALRAGANGYVNKGCESAKIMEAVQTVLAGRTFLAPEIAAKLLGRIAGDDRDKGPVYVDKLTDRELEAFELLGQGMTTQQIAVKMHVSPKTVETYRARIKEKLGLNNATELMQHAVQWVIGKNQDVP